MSDEVIISSTTDTEAEINAAMQHGMEPPASDTVLSVVEDEPEPAVEGEKKDEEKPAEKELTAEEKDAAEKKELQAKADKEALGARAEKRIAKLVAEREDANRRAEAAEARAKAAEEKKAPEAEKVAATVALDAEWLKTNPEPKQEAFDEYDAFSKVWVKWEMDRREVISVKHAEEAGRKAAQKVIDDKAASEKIAKEAADTTALFQRFEEGKEVARARYADFDEVLAAAKDLKLSGPMQYVIMDSVVGHDIAHWLAMPENREEAEHLAGLEGSEAIRELGRLERTIELQVADLEAAGGADEKVDAATVAPKKKIAAVTKTTDPVRPVGGRAVAATVDLNDPNMDQVAWKTARNRQEFERRRRR